MGSDEGKAADSAQGAERDSTPAGGESSASEASGEGFGEATPSGLPTPTLVARPAPASPPPPPATGAQGRSTKAHRLVDLPPSRDSGLIESADSLHPEGALSHEELTPPRTLEAPAVDVLADTRSDSRHEPPEPTVVFSNDDWSDPSSRQQAAHAELEDDPLANLPEGRFFTLRPGFELRIGRLLGKGGMGVVYLVDDLELGRQAALKLIRGRGARLERRVKRFRRETRITACLNHPSIPPVIEAGVTPDGDHYLLMRYVAGESLDARMKRLREQHGEGPLPRAEERDLLEALVRVCEAVAYAHAQGIVHRDLKPDNIMIGAFGEVFVMDWGLARNLKESEEEDAALRTAFKRQDKALLNQTELTRDGAALGTVGFMAPEQARGEEIDARVDQFAFGAILGLVMTGKSVLGDFSLQRLESSLSGRITRPSELSLQVAPALDAIAVKALAPQRGYRYPDMQALAEDLRRYLSGEPVSVYDYRLSERLILTVKRHPTLSVTLAAALLIVTFIGWQRVHRRATLERFLAQGERALRDEDPTAARSAFERARGIEDAASAKLGLQLTEQLEREQAEQRAAALLERAADALEGDRLDEARDLYARVKGLPGAEGEAQKGLRRVKLRALEIERERQQAATHQQLVERAQGHVEVARRSLSAGELQDAYVRLVQAMAFDLPEVRADVTPLLNEVNERRVQERVEQARQANRERAQAYVEAGQGALAGERFGEARAQFERALGLDGESEDARAGLDAAFRGLSEEEQRRRQRGRLDEARKLLARGRALRQQTRQRYRQREDLVVVLEGYFDALDKLQRGLSLDPSSEPLRDERRELGSELAAVLRSEGQAPFADFVLRWCGSKARDTRRVLPRDPYLEVIEGDKVLIRQALGESTRFAPTKAFEDVRRFVEKHANRYRFHVVIRSRITTIASSPSPKVLLQAIDIKREDKKTRTFQILGQIPIEGTYVRHSQKSKVGRVVSAIDEATDPSARGRRGSFPLERYVRKVREVVQASLRDIGSGQRTWRPLAESWEVLDLVDLRLALRVPEGVRFRPGPSPGPGWKSLTTAYSGVAATLFVRNGKAPDEVELEHFVERRLGVRDSLWRELPGFRASPGWDRVRALRAADASALQLGVFGVGGYGAYVLLLRTSDERYEADPAGFSKWLGSLRPDLRK